jgi:hypothetical protein
MLNFPPAEVVSPESRGFWPWERPAATFAPSWDIIENGWLVGVWTIARLAGPPRASLQSRVVRSRNSRGMVDSIQVFSDDSTRPTRSISLDYDHEGRLLEFFEESTGRRHRLSFEYNARGDVVREKSVLVPEPGAPAQVRTAQSFYDADGRLRRVIVRDRRGRLLECRLFDATGSHVSTRSYGPDGRLEATETVSRDTQRRKITLVEVRYSLHGPSGMIRPESRRSDLSEYDRSGGLLRREIVDERNRGSGGQVSWCRVVREVIRYDSHVDRPLFDRSEFYNQWSETAALETVYLINIDYHYNGRDRRPAGSVTTECDFLDNTVVHNTTRVDYNVEGKPPTSPCLPFLGGDADRHVIHEYRHDGHLRRRRVFEGSPGIQTQAAVYE